MKKYSFLAIVLILLIAVLGGCSDSRQTEVPAVPVTQNPEVVKNFTDPAKTIETSIDTEFEILLESNPTTGYTWEGNDVYDKNMLELVKSEYIPSEPGLMGSGGTQKYIFKALKAGNTEISLTDKRSWEKTESDKTLVFKVTVK